jgi:limonene-1,2-epoxide hydrolase
MMETNDPVRAAEVLAVLEAETRAFWEKDYDAFARCWAPEAYVRRGGWWQRGGVGWRRGWDEIAAITREQFAENPDVNVSAKAVRRENVVVRVGADMAWVTFDQHAPDAGEADMDMPGLSHETRILEWRDGCWVIVYVGYLLVG